MRELEASRAQVQEQTPEGGTTFADLGKRVGDILTLAEDEAADIVSTAQGEADMLLRESQAAAGRVRTEAQEYAAARRADADEEAEATVAALRRSDELNDEASREASARRAEADALYEAQQADAAQAAADFETTLAERRDKAERKFATESDRQGRAVDAQAHLDFAPATT